MMQRRQIVQIQSWISQLGASWNGPSLSTLVEADQARDKARPEPESLRRAFQWVSIPY